MAILARFSSLAVTALMAGALRTALDNAGMFALVGAAISAIGGIVITYFFNLSVEARILVVLLAIVAVPSGLVLLVFIFILLRNYFRSLNSERYWKWSKEFDHVVSNRESLWQAAQHKYAEWRRDDSSLPEDLRLLVRSAGFPAAVLKLKHCTLAQLDLTEGLSIDSKRLANFAEEIYPSNKVQNSPNDEKCRELDAARRQLAKFWDLTGRLHFHFMDLSEYELEDPLRTCANDLVFLVYLEWALARQRQESGVGKQGLFKLCKLVESRSWRHGAR